LTASWTSTLTNRLLLEAGVFQQTFRWMWFPLDGTNPDVIGVLEQSNAINYKLRAAGYADRMQHDLRYRAALSYVTGAHAFKVSFPEESYGPIQFAPTRSYTLPAATNANWKDVTPRIGAAYDVFGNGKTAFKVSLNKYLIGADGPAFTYGTQAPYGRVVH